MLGIVHEGVAFPVVWCLLNKRGNSNSTERMNLFNQFLERFGNRDIAYLTANREFVGKDWFGYLLIETLFGIFKTRGFCLESTHLKDSERLSKLLALLSLALCWVILTGECLHQLKPLTIKKHGRRGCYEL